MKNEIFATHAFIKKLVTSTPMPRLPGERRPEYTDSSDSGISMLLAPLSLPRGIKRQLSILGGGKLRGGGDAGLPGALCD